MSSASIVYFSGTGNTKIIAELFRESFEQNGYAARTFSLSVFDGQNEIDYDADFIGIGYPIHAFNAPEIVLKAAKLFPKRDKRLPKKKVFVFKTSGEPVRMSDVSSLKLRSILKRRGYEISCEFQYVMPYNIIFRHTQARAHRMLETAKKLVPIDCKTVLNGGRELPRYPAFGGLVSWVLRIEHPGAHTIGKYFKTADTCTACGYCAKTCPVGNIELTEDGDGNKKIKFGKKCIICMHCAFACPHDAVLPGILKNWKVNGAYSFEKPDREEHDDHADYCKKAYDRYYVNAEKKISNARKSETDENGAE